ncbi:hypothetical protein [Bernardetia sp.]|uniref:hypothetical protein n=1 Tax=Bernardetia sp. TaxID=1937974 RepID=UPI0025B974EF|nr:hypothetical protein [Bernardetia sp.]
MAFETKTKLKIEKRVSELKTVQSDYFKKKKSERSSEGLEEARKELNRLKTILANDYRGRENSQEDMDYVSSNFA